MAGVPLYDTQQVREQAAPGARQRIGASPELLGGGSQGKQLGAGLLASSTTLGNIAAQVQDETNQIRVDDALNKANELQVRLRASPEEGFTNLLGEDALNRPDKQPLSEEYMGKLNKGLDEISSGLGNDRQREYFARHAGTIKSNFYGQLLEHESTQFKGYALSVQEGRQTIATNMAQMHWDDPTAITEQLDTLKTSVMRQAELQGKSETWAIAQTQKLQSNAVRGALEAAIINKNPGYAQAYMQKHADQLTMDDALAVQSKLTILVDTQFAVGAVDDLLTQAAPMLDPTDGDRLMNITWNTESKGQQFGVSGVPTTSSVGAVGVGQVLPTTAPEAAKLAGLEWNPELFNRKSTGDDTKDAEAAVYNKALSRAYFAQKMKDNGNDPAMAWAAYNAGQGRLNEGIAAAKAAGDPNWLKYMPEETQKYVAKNVRAYTTGGGVPQKPTLEDADNALRAVPGMDVTRYKIASAELTRRMAIHDKAIKQRDDEVTADAVRYIDENGKMPDDKSHIPAKEIPKLERYAALKAKGTPVATDYSVFTHYEMNSEALLGLDEAGMLKLKASLSDTDYKSLLTRRNSLLSGELKITETKIDDEDFKSIAFTAGHLPAYAKAKDLKEDDLRGLGQLHSRVDTVISEAAARAPGHRLTRKEKQDIMKHEIANYSVNLVHRHYLSKDEVVSKPFYAASEEDLKNAVLVLDTGEQVKWDDIDEASKTEIQAGLVASGTEPTPLAVADVWAGRHRK